MGNGSGKAEDGTQKNSTTHRNDGDRHSYSEDLAEQKREDILREQENMRKWIEEDIPPPVKVSCKISKHIVSKKRTEND
jgi:hypothetical protein